MDPDFFELEVLEYEQLGQRRPSKPRVYLPREDPRVSLSDFEFKKHFRFNKDSVGRLTELLHDDLVFDTKRGLPVPPIQQVCIALNHYGGGHFQRISAWCAGVSQNGARLSILRVTEALVRRKSEFINMPGTDQMQDTAQRMLEKFHLPGFAFAVDGVQMRFTEAPRGIPDDKVQQMFWCRKQFFSLNVQVVGNDKFIYDVDVGWPGSTHDARCWNRSEVKRVVEEQKRFYIAGDSGYPISDNLIKPYPINESSRDRRKRKFNRRLSGLRTVMSECLFGVWKRRWPALKNLRMDLESSQKIILATAVLFNIARLWEDENPMEEDQDENGGDSDEDDNFVVQDHAPATVRLRGQIERERLKDSMPE